MSWNYGNMLHSSAHATITTSAGANTASASAANPFLWNLDEPLQQTQQQQQQQQDHQHQQHQHQHQHYQQHQRQHQQHQHQRQQSYNNLYARQTTPTASSSYNSNNCNNFTKTNSYGSNATTTMLQHGLEFCRQQSNSISNSSIQQQFMDFERSLMNHSSDKNNMREIVNIALSESDNNEEDGCNTTNNNNNNNNNDDDHNDVDNDTDGDDKNNKLANSVYAAEVALSDVAGHTTNIANKVHVLMRSKQNVNNNNNMDNKTEEPEQNCATATDIPTTSLQTTNNSGKILNA